MKGFFEAFAARMERWIGGGLCWLAWRIDLFAAHNGSPTAQNGKRTDIHRIQTALFPEQLPELEGMELAGEVHSAERVGGDFYAAARGAEGEWILAVGDVAGKGVPAAYLAAATHAVLRDESPVCPSPEILLNVMNTRLYEQLDEAETFITIAVAALDPVNQRIRFASAGHVDGMLWRAALGEPVSMRATGLPLGIYASTTYTSSEFDFQAGDVLLLHSDGITESESPGGKLLGQQGLTDLLFACHPAAAQDQVQMLLRALEVHRQGQVQRDDVALLLCRFIEGMEEPRDVRPFVISAEPRSIHGVVDMVRSLIQHQERVPGLSADVLEDFALALAEVVANQIKHAYGMQSGRIQGRLILDKMTLSADTFDYGEPYEPCHPQIELIDPANPPEGGYGMRMIAALTDRWTYASLAGGRNHWHIMKTLSGAGER